jgi:hypothetical protein
MVKNASGNEAWRPDEGSPESAYEGRQPPEDVETNDIGRRTRPTGGTPSAPEKGVGPEAGRADREKRRDAGGDPSERE